MHTIAWVALAAACSDYDLMRGAEPSGSPVDTGTPDAPADAPDIAVTPERLDFGSIPKGCTSAPLEVTITNEGTAELVVSGISLDGSGYGAFATSWDGGEIRLAPGASTTIEVSFSPTAWIDYDVDLFVTSNDPDEATVRVEAIGTGAEDATYEQTFEQDFFDMLDVLWVVDNSGSMSDDLVRVANNFDAFITVFLDLGLDYHIAVVTTDMDDPNDSGRFQGPVITTETADPVGEFLAQVDQGSGGSASEKGFEAIYAALTEPLLSTTNAGFLRDDAALAAIVLSDEDDDSWMTPDQFATWFEGLKPSADMATFSTICEDLFINCYQYSEAADLTGGMVGDITTTDYIEVLEQISMTSAGLVVSFDLDHEPSSVADMHVYVEGVEVDQDSTNGWTYDSLDNAVVFHGDAVPEPGESGLIVYPVAGECP